MSTIFRALCLVSAIATVRGAVISVGNASFSFSIPISTVFSAVSTATDPGSEPTDTGFPFTPDPTPTDPGAGLPTGGFLLTGVYTTCLTLTFAAVPTGDSIGDVGTGTVTNSVITVDAASRPTATPVGDAIQFPERAHRHKHRPQSQSQSSTGDAEPTSASTTAADPDATPTPTDPDADPNPSDGDPDATPTPTEPGSDPDPTDGNPDPTPDPTDPDSDPDPTDGDPDSSSTPTDPATDPPTASAAVFTTCLVFLPMPTPTPDGSPVGGE
ncbi:hypothetical protein FB451DRAFT_1163736 [Mycena latifolia]|nr:hypothetical protein FB451DRAFT_1163736 [Mycena latifolia]